MQTMAQPIHIQYTINLKYTGHKQNAEQSMHLQALNMLLWICVECINEKSKYQVH